MSRRPIYRLRLATFRAPAIVFLTLFSFTGEAPAGFALVKRQRIR